MTTHPPETGFNQEEMLSCSKLFERSSKSALYSDAWGVREGKPLPPNRSTLGFEVRPWMWFPILGVPLLAVVLLALLKGAPAEEARMNQEARRLLKRLDVLARAAPREGER